MTTYQYPTKSERAGISRPEPVLNWAKLAKSDYIEIHRDGKAIAQGEIDMLALDGSLLLASPKRRKRQSVVPAT